MSDLSITTPHFFTQQLTLVCKILYDALFQQSIPSPYLSHEQEREKKFAELLALLEKHSLSAKLSEAVAELVYWIDTHPDPKNDPVFHSLEKLSSVITTQFTSDMPHTLQEILGLSDCCVHRIYDIALQLHSDKQWELAEKLLTLLTTLNPFVPEYASFLGQVLACQTKYEEALYPLSLAILLSPHTPLFRLYASECYLAIQDMQSAQIEFSCAQQAADKEEEYALLASFLESHPQLKETA